MSMTSRLIYRLSAISIHPGGLPLFSWSLATPQAPSAEPTDQSLSSPSPLRSSSQTSDGVNAASDGRVSADINKVATSTKASTSNLTAHSESQQKHPPQPHGQERALAREVSYASAVSELQLETQDLRHFIAKQFAATHGGSNGSTGGEAGAGRRQGGLGKRKRVLFMGEHHEQPRVLAAQLIILDELVQVARRSGAKARPGGESAVDVDENTARLEEQTKARNRDPGVVLVAEQFNVLQQGILDKFCGWHDPKRVLDASASSSLGNEAQQYLESIAEAKLTANANMPDAHGSISPDVHAISEQRAATELLDDYISTTPASDAFNLPHYMPLLLHARSQGVRIVGGFPPRSWARVVSKSGVAALREHHGAEIAAVLGLGFGDLGERWGDANCEAQHAAYIRSLMRGEAPVVEEWSDGGRVGGGSPGKGVLIAQAFKDAVLASVVDVQLRGDVRASDRLDGHTDLDDQSHRNAPLVMVVTGSGHCEYGFGAPERVRECSRDEMCVVICKSQDESMVWQGKRWGGEQQGQDDRVMADGVVLYDQI